MSKITLPSERKIREYWANAFTIQELRRKTFFNPSELMREGSCFACGWACHGTEKAHIVARSMGGSDEVDNIHMLCPFCHEDSEYRDTPERYWAWFWERMPLDAVARCALRHGTSPPQMVHEVMASQPRYASEWTHVPSAPALPLVRYKMSCQD